MLRHHLFNLYSILYGLCLWASVYFLHGDHNYNVSFRSAEYSIGILFLAWVSTFRDLAQMSGLRFRSIAILVIMSGYLYIAFDNHIAVAAIAALFWTEILDFLIFTGLFHLLQDRPWRSLAAVVVSDIVTIPALWFLLLTFLGYPLDVLPADVLYVQYIALAVLYAVFALIYLPNGRWLRYLSVQKVR